MDQERSGFAAALVHLKPEVQLLAMLNDTGSLKQDEVSALKDYIERHTGMSEEFVAFHLGNTATPQTLLEAWVGWLLCVEYVFDLKRSPVLKELQGILKLSAPLKKTCASLLEMLRKQTPDRYRQFANQTEAVIERDLEGGSADELGRIDTFHREDSRLLEAAVQALEAQQWSQAHTWASSRLSSPSVWLESDTLRRQEWRLVEVSAHLGQLIQTFDKPLKGATSLSEALELYLGNAPGAPAIHRVDQAHRHFEQERLRLLIPRLRHFQQLALATARVRALYHEWVDRLTGEFMEICSNYGYLPESSLQQRSLYEDVVHPLAQRANTTVAYFMVDGLRFEMAAELAQRLQKPGLQLQLKARFAELPSITRVGMNVLAPVSRQGHLKVSGSFQGFRAGEYVVSSPQQRLRSMGERSLDSLPGGRKSPLGLSLSQISNEQPQALKKKIGKSPLIVVHSREIDNAGESDIGVATYDTWLGQLHSAISLLRNAGISEFVITSDHGFLILDETRQHLSCSTKREDGRRFLVSDAPMSLEGTGAVALHTLGYDDMPGYLVFPRDGSTFSAAGDVSPTFTHGGNSLQERVIPVLRLTYRHRDIDGLGSYTLEARAEAPILGHSRLKVRLKEDVETLLSFEKKVIPLALRVVEPDKAGIRVSCKVVNGGELRHQQIMLSVGAEWAEVLFTLEGGTEARAAIQIYHPDGSENIAPVRLPEFFDVMTRIPPPERSSDESDGPAPESQPQETTSWAEQIADEGHRRILLHIGSYGNINEDEITDMLGTPTAARKFSRKYEAYLCFLPFAIGIDTLGTVKRYVKKG